VKGMKEESGGKKVDQFERFICVRENFVFDSLIYLEPVERFKNRSNVMKFRRFGDSTSSRNQDKLKMKLKLFGPNLDSSLIKAIIIQEL